MKIRFAEIEDVPAILKLLQQVGSLHNKLRPDIFRVGAQKYSASQVFSMLNKPGAPIFVAEDRKKVVGYCFCNLKKYEKDPVMTDRTELYIDDLCVDEKKRGKHIGAALYEAVCLYARQCGCHSITLNVWSDNTAAMAFYEKCGLKPQKIGLEQILED